MAGAVSVPLVESRASRRTRSPKGWRNWRRTRPTRPPRVVGGCVSQAPGAAAKGKRGRESIPPGTTTPDPFLQRLLREFERWQFLERQIDELENQRAQQIRQDKTAETEKVRRLLKLKGIGVNGAWSAVCAGPSQSQYSRPDPTRPPTRPQVKTQDLTPPDPPAGPGQGCIW
jgi:hypothetical protein